jgi:hypothetical protein
MDLLDLEYNIDMKDTVLEMAYSMIELGIIPDLRRGKK